jgi:hypothetical protein
MKRKQESSSHEKNKSLKTFPLAQLRPANIEMNEEKIKSLKSWFDDECQIFSLLIKKYNLKSFFEHSRKKLSCEDKYYDSYKLHLQDSFSDDLVMEYYQKCLEYQFQRKCHEVEQIPNQLEYDNLTKDPNYCLSIIKQLTKLDNKQYLALSLSLRQKGYSSYIREKNCGSLRTRVKIHYEVIYHRHDIFTRKFINLYRVNLIKQDLLSFQQWHKDNFDEKTSISMVNDLFK